MHMTHSTTLIFRPQRLTLSEITAAQNEDQEEKEKGFHAAKARPSLA